MPKLLIESIPAQLTLTEAAGGKIIARGEFGRCGVPTQNGRNYSSKLMQREFDRLAEDIRSRRVLGELDHPCLTSDDFRVMTSEGWKEFRDVKKGDRVWSRVEGKAVLSEVTGITDDPYDGDVYRVRGRSISATFTPAHKFLLLKRPGRDNSGEEEFVSVAEIAENRSRYGHYAIPKTAEFYAETMPHVIIPGVDVKRLASCKNDVSQPLELDTQLFAAFMGIYLAEGNCSSESVDNYDVCITQKKEWSKKFIYDEVLSKFPDHLGWRETKTGYALADARLHGYLKKLGNAYEKHVPDEVKRLDADSLKELIFWFCIGDGRMVSSNASRRMAVTSGECSTKEALAESLRLGQIPFTRQDVFSVSEVLVMDLHECLVKSGGSGSISKIETEHNYEYAGHIIKAENKVPLYQLHINQTENIWMDPRHLEVDKESYSGNIYCLTTTHGSFYMEMNGYAFWTGNSDGKTSLKRVSHVITGLKIKGGIVIGEAEILDTPEGRTLKALIEANVQIGISSRGYGSTQPGSGKDEGEIVQDDFVLKTFDFVGDPAMKTAYPEIVAEDINGDQPDPSELFLDEFPEIAESIRSKALEEARLGLGPGGICSCTKCSYTEDHVTGEPCEDKKCPKCNNAMVRKTAAESMSEQFEKQLAEALLEAKEDISNELREEFISDPELGGAKAVLNAISEMVSVYRADPDERAVEDAVKASELAAAEANKERDEAEERAIQSDCKAHIESEIGGHAMAETIRTLVKRQRFTDIEDAKEKLKAILGDLPDRAEEVSEEEAELREENASLKGEVSLLTERAEALNSKLKKAVDVGMRADTQLEETEARVEKAERDRKEALKELKEAEAEFEIEVYKHEKVAGLANGRKLLSLMEDYTSKAAVDRLVSERGSDSVSDGELVSMRRSLRRGTGERQELHEGLQKKTQSAPMGMDMKEMQHFAGIKKDS